MNNASQLCSELISGEEKTKLVTAVKAKNMLSQASVPVGERNRQNKRKLASARSKDVARAQLNNIYLSSNGMPLPLRRYSA